MSDKSSDTTLILPSRCIICSIHWAALVGLSDLQVYEVLHKVRLLDYEAIAGTFPQLVSKEPTPIVLPASVLRRMAVYVIKRNTVEAELRSRQTTLLQRLAFDVFNPSARGGENPSFAAFANWVDVLNLAFGDMVPGMVRCFHDTPEVTERNKAFYQDTADTIGGPPRIYEDLPVELLSQLAGRLVACGTDVTFHGTAMAIVGIRAWDIERHTEMTWHVCNMTPYDPRLHVFSHITLAPIEHIDFTR